MNSQPSPPSKGDPAPSTPPLAHLSEILPDPSSVEGPPEETTEAGASLTEAIKTIVIGKPRDLADESLFKHLSLVAFLAWVGLGADGPSSSCYGPAEAFHSLGEHHYLAVPPTAPRVPPLDPQRPTAVILVGGHGGLGVHTFLNAYRFAPKHNHNFIFISVGVVDSGSFKGTDELDDLRETTEAALTRYVRLARSQGVPAASYMAIGADVVDELERLVTAVVTTYPKTTVFAGQLVFQRDAWYQHLLHNLTAYALQRRLQWEGIPMVILPTRVR